MRKALIVAFLASLLLAGCTDQGGNKPQTIPEDSAPAAIPPTAKYVFGAEMMESGAHYPLAQESITQNIPSETHRSAAAEVLLQANLGNGRHFAAVQYFWQSVDSTTGRPLKDKLEVWALAWGDDATPSYWKELAGMESENGQSILRESRIGEDWILWYKNEKTPSGWEPDSSLWRWMNN